MYTGQIIAGFPRSVKEVLGTQKSFFRNIKKPVKEQRVISLRSFFTMKEIFFTAD